MNHRTVKTIVFIGFVALQLNAISAQAVTLSTNAAWTWIKGANIVNQNGIYGTQGVASPTNTPGARYRAVSWTGTNSTLWLFGGNGYDALGGVGYLNDLWQYNPATTNWTWIKGATTNNQNGTYGTQDVPAASNTPGARYGAVSWTDSSGALWLFGGYGYPVSGGFGYLNDLWKYDSLTTNWTWIKGSNTVNQNGTYGTQGVPAATNTPGARYAAVSWTDSSGALWLFGGNGYSASGGVGYLNDLWQYNPATTNWTWMKGSTTTVQYGTYGMQGVAGSTNTPGARYIAVSWTNGSGALWLFGGYGFSASGSAAFLNDLWKYDPATTNWTWMKGTNVIDQRGIYGTQGVASLTNTPGARYRAVSWTGTNSTLWLFSGEGYPASGSSGVLNDLWKYDPATTNWTWMKGATNISQNGTYGTQGVPAAGNMPGARENAVSWTDTNSALWLFGGSGYPASGGSGYLNDLWKYDDLVGGISLATNALVFSTTYQGANPAAQLIAMTNVGGSGFTYTNIITYSVGASGWLTILPAAGAVASGSATTLTNQVNIAGLDAGTYYATNQVVAIDASNSPQTVVATLTVNKADQRIIFSVIADQLVTNTVGLSATASSGLPVSFSVGSGPAQITNSTNLSFTATGLVMIVAGQAGNGNWNAAPNVTNSFAVTSLPTPQNVAASDGRYADKIALTWSAVSGVTGYQVWRATNSEQSEIGGQRSEIRGQGSDGGRSQIGETTGTNFNDTSAAVGQIYYYWVKATNASATSAFSSSDSGWRRSVGYTHYADVDLDGDRKMDLVLFDPVTGAWSAKLSASGYAEVSVLLGGPTSTPVPGDYDGDVKTDPGVYEEPTGLWTVMLSSMGYGRASATLGGLGYAPVPSDFDGDRKTDLGVYRSATPSTGSGQAGAWTVKLSASGYAEAGTTFGGSDYLPVQRDYDGDAKSDPAIYNLTNGNWRVMLSGSGYGIASAPGFGGAGYAPVPGDYDGDGKGDPAIYSESAGTWVIMLSASGYLIATATLGGTGYAPLPGDYDGDGKTDPAVYHTSTGQWLVMLSGSGYGIAMATFGGEGYDPVGFGPEQGGWQSAKH